MMTVALGENAVVFFPVRRPGQCVAPQGSTRLQQLGDEDAGPCTLGWKDRLTGVPRSAPSCWWQS